MKALAAQPSCTSSYTGTHLPTVTRMTQATGAGGWRAGQWGRRLGLYLSGSLELGAALPDQRGTETLFISCQRC